MVYSQREDFLITAKVDQTLDNHRNQNQTYGLKIETHVAEEVSAINHALP